MPNKAKRDCHSAYRNQQSKWTTNSYYSVNAKARNKFCLDNNSNEGLPKKKKIRSHFWKRVSATVTIIQGGVHVQARFAKNLQISLVWPSHQFCYKKHLCEQVSWWQFYKNWRCTSGEREDLSVSSAKGPTNSRHATASLSSAEPQWPTLL